MKNKYYKFSIVIFFIFTFLIFYYGLKQKNFYTPEDISIKTLPNLFLKDFYTNNETSFNDILVDSNYYLINIWASWCLPCKAEHPYLINLNERFDINLIGINYKDNLDNSKKFLSDLGNPYDEVLVDSDGIKSIELGAIGVPETYLINNEYKIIKKFIGPLDQDDYENIISLIKK